MKHVQCLWFRVQWFSISWRLHRHAKMIHFVHFIRCPRAHFGVSVRRDSAVTSFLPPSFSAFPFLILVSFLPFSAPPFCLFSSFFCCPSSPLFSRSGITPSTMSCVLPLCVADREKMAQIMFETFKIPSTYVSITPILTLYTAACTAGFALVCGGMTFQCASVYDGYSLPSSFLHLELAGSDITDYLMKMFNDASHMIEREMINNIKEKLVLCGPRFWRKIACLCI